MAVPLSAKKLSQARKTFNIYNLLNSFHSLLFLVLLLRFCTQDGSTKQPYWTIECISLCNVLYAASRQALCDPWCLCGEGIRLGLGDPLSRAYSRALRTVLALKGQPGIGLLLLILSTAGFHIARGIAMIGNNPVLGLLSPGGGDKPRSDQGRYLANISVINSVAAILANIVIAFLLGQNATLWRYAIAVGIGIATGLASCVFLFKTPEPDAFSSKDDVSIAKVTREALEKPEFRAFIYTFMLLSFLSGMGRSFLPVYAKEVFSQGDDAIMVYSIVASLGSIVMGLITRLVVDRLGSKPLFIIFSAIGLVSFLPIAIIPSPGAFLAAPATIALFLSVVHFLSSFGFAGEESVAQVYYFGLIPKEKMLDLAVIYNLAYGIGGASARSLAVACFKCSQISDLHPRAPLESIMR